ncbi:MAG TPA: hypothetical protein VIN10_05925 [Bacteroidales bacterium]
MRKTIISLLLLLSSFYYLTAQEQSAETKSIEDKWHFELTPYFWATSMYANIELGPISFESDTRFKDIFANLEYAIPFHFEFGKGRWTVITDFLYVENQMNQEAQYTIFPKLPEKTTIDFSSVYTLTKLQWEALGAYTVRTHNTKNAACKIDALLGVRFTRIENNLELTKQGVLDTLAVFPFSFTEQYVDPLIGAAYTAHIHKKWKFYLRADIGGFSVGSKFTSNIITNISFQAVRFMDVNLGYRWLYTNYDNGKSGAEYYSNKSNELGPIFSLTFKW